MALRMLAWVMLGIAACGPAIAEPFVPASDVEVLERLAVSPSDPALHQLRALQGQLLQAPDNLVLATRVATGYLELGRVTGDPRYAGYSEAALTRGGISIIRPRKCWSCAPHCGSECISSTPPWQIWRRC
jgi:hypothetical protein